MSSETKRCAYVKDDGERCRMENQLAEYEGELRCIWHDPHREEEAQAARKRGARTRAEQQRRNGKPDPDEVPPPPETLEDGVTWSAWAAWAAATGRLNTARANAAARLLKEFRQALEKSESRAKLEEIRARVEELTGDGDAPDLEAL